MEAVHEEAQSTHTIEGGVGWRLHWRGPAVPGYFPGWQRPGPRLDGQRLPVRFGTWVWGCGFIPERWIPTHDGIGLRAVAGSQPLAPYKSKLAVFSGYDVKLDGVANKPHITGCLGLRTGIPVPSENVRAATLDVLIGDAISAGSRFSSIEVSTSGIERSYSYRAAGSPNPSEISPVALYQRIFGEGFQDPNAATFTPDPNTMVRESVLSAVAEDRQRVMRSVGAEDRRRLEEYFTSIRHLEEQLALQLQPPARVENFTKPDAPPSHADGFGNRQRDGHS
jgi:hypothetical protein